MSKKNKEIHTGKGETDMNFVLGLLIGFFLGWLVELIIDWLFWRRGRDVGVNYQAELDAKDAENKTLREKLSAAQDSADACQDDLAQAQDKADELKAQLAAAEKEQAAKMAALAAGSTVVGAASDEDAAGDGANVMLAGGVLSIDADEGDTPDATTPATSAVPAAPPKPDDLKKIEGIGPKIQSILRAAGISTFAQLAEASYESLRELLDSNNIKGIADPSTWGEQAKLAAQGNWDTLEELQDRLKGGRRVD